MPQVFRRFVIVAVLLTSGCLCVQRTAALPPRPPLAPQALVLVVDGAGGFKAASKSIQETATRQGIRIEVEAVNWTHGYLRVVADHVDAKHARSVGKQLAAEILVRKEQWPATPIYLVGHSAGSLVALTAAESLPPNTLERVILLAPAVSEAYDLRPTLICARQSVDVFYSEHDWGYLGIGVFFVGTSDRRFRPAAGRVGFSVDQSNPADAALYAKLRQYPWHPCVAWSGNPGGHYGPYQPGFLSAYVLPLFSPGGEFSPVISRADLLQVK